MKKRPILAKKMRQKPKLYEAVVDRVKRKMKEICVNGRACARRGKVGFQQAGKLGSDQN